MFKFKFKNKYQLVVWLVFLIGSIVSIFNVMMDIDKPKVYLAIFLMPFVFMICSVIFAQVYVKMFDNLGATVILILLFVRNVILPLLMSKYGYTTRIATNPNDNMIFAILLMAYEEVAIFMLLHYKCLKSKKIYFHGCNNLEKKKFTNKMYGILLTFIILSLIGCILIAPQILDGYRTIFEMGDELFATYEDTQLVAKYATSTLRRFAIVTGNYIMRAILAILPGYMIIKLSLRKTFVKQFISLLFCFTPAFFIGGVIARSLVYIVCLLILYFYIYDEKNISKRIAQLLFFAAIAVIVWWGFKSTDSYGLQELTEKLSAYFAGVNNVYGSFQLPNELKTKFSYFIYDYMDAMPYGGTIFNSSHKLFSELFNECNGVRGQIGTTVGVGWYYFGFLFAPLYSVIFANVSFEAGEKLRRSINQNSLVTIRLLLTAMYFAMGIGMYNVSITLTNFFTMLLPMFILEKLAYKNRGGM